MSQPESRLSKKIMEALRKEGAFCIKVHGSEYMMEGLPDILGCYEGRFFAFETKMPAKRGNTSLKQERVMGLIQRAGGYACVVCSVAEALDKLAEVVSIWDPGFDKGKGS